MVQLAADPLAAALIATARKIQWEVRPEDALAPGKKTAETDGGLEPETRLSFPMQAWHYISQYKWD